MKANASRKGAGYLIILLFCLIIISYRRNMAVVLCYPK
jgi:hypothetical protein